MNDPTKVARAKRPVLVPGCQAIGMIAVVRSLGRAGYPVHACSQHADALGLQSNFATRASVHPPLSDAAFETWFRNYVRDNDIQAIIPGGGIMPVGHPVFRDYAHLFVAPHDLSLVQNASTKYFLFDQIAAAGPALRAHTPPFLLLRDDTDLPTERELEDLGTPLFIKLDAAYAKGPHESAVIPCESAAKCRSELESLRASFSRMLVQGFVAGQGVGAFFSIWNGEIHAAFMHRRLHEVPHRGGVSSYRESFWHDKIWQDAERKLRHLGWQGVAMVEYRWDPKTDAFHLMEMNLRFWGSLHLALFAGVDFPCIALDTFHGHPPSQTVRQARRARCRNTFPFEVQHVWSIWKDPETGWKRRFAAILEFGYLSLHPGIHSDLCFPGDRGLYWKRLWRFLRTRG